MSKVRCYDCYWCAYGMPGGRSDCGTCAPCYCIRESMEGVPIPEPQEEIDCEHFVHWEYVEPEEDADE